MADKPRMDPPSQGLRRDRLRINAKVIRRMDTLGGCDEKWTSVDVVDLVN
jgi:hypothetical protein